MTADRSSLRIVVVRLSAMGDVLSTIPAYLALQAAFPEATFGWVVEKPFVPIVEGLVGLVQVFPLKTREWRRALLSGSTRNEVLGVFSDIASFEADIAIDFQGTMKSAVTAWLSRAKRRFGLGCGDLREPAATFFYSDRAKSAPEPAVRHVVERGLELAATVVRDLGGVSLAGTGEEGLRHRTAFALHVPEDPDGRIAAFLAPRGTKRFVLIQPAAGWANKEWGADRFGRLASLVLEGTKIDSVVAWGPGEEEVARDVVSRSGGSAVLAPTTTIPEFARLASRAAVVVGGDTGPTHLAAALGVATVGVFGPTAGETHGPFGPRATFIEDRLPCRPCSRRYRSRKPCLEAISVETVADAVIERLV